MRSASERRASTSGVRHLARLFGCPQKIYKRCGSGRLPLRFVNLPQKEKHHARNYCHHLGRPLDSGSCDLVHHGRIHSCPLSHRGRGHSGSCHSRSKRIRPLETRRRQEPYRGVWRGSCSSGFLGLSRLVGSTNQRDKTDPRIREAASESPLPSHNAPTSSPE